MHEMQSFLYDSHDDEDFEETPEMKRLAEEHAEKMRIDAEESRQRRIQEFNEQTDELTKARESNIETYTYLEKAEPCKYVPFNSSYRRDLGYTDIECYSAPIRVHNIGTLLGYQPESGNVESEKGILQMKKGVHRLIDSNSSKGMDYAELVLKNQIGTKNKLGHVSSSLDTGNFMLATLQRSNETNVPPSPSPSKPHIFPPLTSYRGVKI
jgi:hypothetical protein